MYSGKLAWPLCGWSKLTWHQRGVLNLTWFQCRDEIDLVYVRVVEIDLFGGAEFTFCFRGGRKRVCRSKLPLFFCRRIEIDSMLDWGSKLIPFQRWGPKKNDFCERDRKWRGLSVRDLFLRGHQHLLRFGVRAENYLVLIYGSKLTVFSVGIEIDLVLQCGPKKTCF